MATQTRERILDATAELFRRHGYTGTGLKQIVAAASAPFGSVYHHFPGGKEQLGAEVVLRSGRMYFELFELIFDAEPDPLEAVRGFFLGAGETLRVTDYADACPIGTVALEVASTNEPLRLATAEVFEDWIVRGAARFEGLGLEPAAARALIIQFVALLEGAFMLARAAKSLEAMERAAEAAVALTRAALQQSVDTAG